MSASTDPSADAATAPTEAIVAAIAAREGVDVTDVEPPAYDPLYSVVNPEALNRLFRTLDGPAATARVVLEYEGYEIVVHADGSVDVSERSNPNSDRDESSSLEDPFED